MKVEGSEGESGGTSQIAVSDSTSKLTTEQRGCSDDISIGEDDEWGISMPVVQKRR